MNKYSEWGSYILGVFMIVMGLMKIFGDAPIFTIIENNLDSKYGLDFLFIDPQTPMLFITTVVSFLV